MKYSIRDLLLSLLDDRNTDLRLAARKISKTSVPLTTVLKTSLLQPALTKPQP